MREILLAVTAMLCTTMATATDDNTILSCAGTTKSYGLNAPKWVQFASPEESAGDLFEIAPDRSHAVGPFNSERLSLCQETATQLRFSDNCKVDLRSYKAEWIRMKDLVAAQNAMQKRYGDYWADIQTLTIDRVNLTAVTEAVALADTMDSKTVPSEQASKGLNIVHYLYARIIEYRGKCKLVKAKI